jgi:hypothetical protein
LVGQFIVKLANYKPNATKHGRNGGWKEEIYIDTNGNAVPYVASFSGLSIFDCPFGTL